jgi:uncharacterized membrane protein (UPF0127 family)
MKQLIGVSLFVCAYAGFGWASASAQVPNLNRVHQLSSLKVVKLKAANHELEAWVMDTDAKNAEGMMFLTDKEVKPNQGMIFLFPKIQPSDSSHGFWMHNTLIPLDIIYISASKKVVSIAEGKVQDDTSLLAKAPYLYVVELKQGTAKKLGIKPGTKFDIPANLKWAD